MKTSVVNVTRSLDPINIMLRNSIINNIESFGWNIWQMMCEFDRRLIKRINVKWEVSFRTIVKID